VAISTCQAVVKGEVAPHDGARRIWKEAWPYARLSPFGGQLAPFIGEATEWEEHPDARGEIEDSIRAQVAALLVDLGQPDS
jgi:hypothetical protein